MIRRRFILGVCFTLLQLGSTACAGWPGLQPVAEVPQALSTQESTSLPTGSTTVSSPASLAVATLVAPSSTVPTTVAAEMPFSSPSPTELPTARPTPADTPTAIPTTAPIATPSATPDPYIEYSVEMLAARAYGGGLLQIEETLAEEETFTRYLFSYPSDGLRIAGYMNVPHEGTRFPVAIMLHGYINPDEYETVAYTRRYADALAEAGYFVFHPNLRNYPPSDSGPDPYRIGFATDVLNLIAIIREQSRDITGSLRRADGDEIHLWGHSMGGGVALRVITVNNESYLKAAVLYGSMSGDERLNYQRIKEWSGGERGGFELSASEGRLREISPIHHLGRIRAAVSIHHSEADEIVPPAWSDDLCRRLEAVEPPVECFNYVGQPHTFRGHGDTLFMERVVKFFDRY